MKILCSLLMAFMLIFSVSDNNTNNYNEFSAEYTEDELRQKYPEYFDLSAFKGIEVYVWQMAENSYRCGALSGTNRNKTADEINELQSNSASIEEMKAILSFYGIPKEDIIIMPCTQPYSSYDYEIDDDYIQKINELFDK